MTRVFIGVGSNLGDRRKNLELAEELVRRTAGIRFLKSSSIYETDPVGGPPQGRFLNAVWELETELPADKLLEALLAIEGRLGRRRDGTNTPRTMDLDILFYGHEVIRRPGLVIPHPRLSGRGFVLRPLAELAPDWIHPEVGRSVRQILEEVLEGNPKS